MKITKPTKKYVEKLRLILSIYQDGTGQLAHKGGNSLPGWRDFERAVALAFEGIAQESKAIFDVLLPTPRTNSFIGISCKMRRELKYPTRENIEVPLELSNSAGKFWDVLIEKHNLTRQTYKQHPQTVGQVLISIVESWHQNASTQMDRKIDLSKSYHLVLLWNKRGYYQLFQFALKLPAYQTLFWHFPPGRDGKPGRHLRGEDKQGKLIEWYGESGGQLKYYPRVSQAIWKSEPFQLEPLPDNTPNGILSKVKTYFPKQWASID